MNRKNISTLISEAMAIENQEAKEAGALGYMCRALVQATLPHRNVLGNEFTRTNGEFTLSLMAPSAVGLPYGALPRLLMAWMATEAVRTKEREILLGDSLSEFMRKIDFEISGGKRGGITRVRNQMERLSSCYISCSYTDKELSQRKSILIADEYSLWWEPKQPDQITLFESTVTLSQKFFDEITNSPVPIDLRALSALRGSAMALDIYTWLTYRNSYLKKPTVIPWGALQMQFGSEYKRTTDFKANFLKHLKKVITIYPDANVSDNPNGLLLMPSRTHIPLIVSR